MLSLFSEKNSDFLELTFKDFPVRGFIDLTELKSYESLRKQDKINSNSTLVSGVTINPSFLKS